MQDTPLRIAVLAGTTREQRKSIYAARFIANVGERLDGVEVRFADPANFTFHGDGNDLEGKDPRYTELTEWADGFFIVVPEYNHGYPGSLKRMLDSELKNYIHKPVAFAGCSSGRWGGVRAIEALVNAVREMGLVACFTDVQFPKVQDIFSESGELREQVYEELVKKVYAELLWMAQTLKHGRANIVPIELN